MEDAPGKNPEILDIVLSEDFNTKRFKIFPYGDMMITQEHNDLFDGPWLYGNYTKVYFDKKNNVIKVE